MNTICNNEKSCILYCSQMAAQRSITSRILHSYSTAEEWHYIKAIIKTEMQINDGKEFHNKTINTKIKSYDWKDISV